jgi:hypothetical protein
MATSDAARRHHDALFPNHRSTLKNTDPELIEIFDDWAFDEVIEDAPLDLRPGQRDARGGSGGERDIDTGRQVPDIERRFPASSNCPNAGTNKKIRRRMAPWTGPPTRNRPIRLPRGPPSRPRTRRFDAR